MSTQRQKIAYLAGPITGKKDTYRTAFYSAEFILNREGWLVLNPASLPEGMPTANYMPICIAMLQQADAIALLPGWMTSDGATLELQYAKYQGKQIIDFEKEYGAEFK